MDALNGPRLYGRFDHGDQRQENTIEWVGEGIMSGLRGVYGFVRLFSPLVFSFAYSKGFLTTPSSSLGLLKFVALALTSAYLARFVGRLLDEEYGRFIVYWRKAFKDEEAKQELKRYDFCLAGAPPDFVAEPSPKLWYLNETIPSNPLYKALAYCAVHSFGIRMLYPGSTGLLNLLLSGSLREARKLAIATKGGKRAILKSARGDIVDALYKEGSGSLRSTLVICSEGNAGYYEIGIMGTVEQLGYSVLGWNQPGFGESTGQPYPETTLASADAVWQYATRKLGYKEQDIVLFGWSIGGFPSTWLAANHQNVKGLVLDATFDDLLPLAKSKMPRFAERIVEVAVRDYLNLHIGAQLAEYKGPVRLIRRLQEEILTEEAENDADRRATNRGNFLLKRLLQQRHPDVLADLEQHVDVWLSQSATERIMSRGLSTSASDEMIRAARLMKLCEHYFVDFDANHVTPLSSAYFNLPTPIPAYHL